jgi:hypothetical protein
MPAARDLSGRLEPRYTAPFRIGIWCDYGFTYVPNEGIGVVIYNLVQGFLALEECVEVVLLVKAGDQERVASFTGQHERLRIVSRLNGSLSWRFRLAGFLKVLVRWLDELQARKKSSGTYLNRGLDRACHALLNGLKYFRSRVRESREGGAPVVAHAG